MGEKAITIQSGTLPSLLFAVSSTLGVSLFANFIAVFSNNFISSLIRTEADLQVIMKVVGNTNSIVTLLSFLIPSVLSIIYIFPVYRACQSGTQGPSFSVAQRRLLNMPLVLGLIGMIGWLIVIVEAVPRVLSEPGDLGWRAFVTYTPGMFLTASLVFVISYYLLEFISRKYFIPGFFPAGRLSESSGTLAPSIRARFFIFFFAVAIYPMLIMVGIARALSAETQADQLTAIMLLGGIILLLGAFLTYLISRSYQAPLVEMAHAAQRIQVGDYEVHVAVVSNDEVGRLGEALNEMVAELKEKEFIKDTFGKVVDPKVRDYLLSGHIALGGEIREAAILFTDIRNFTAISSGMKPDQVVDWLNRYFEKMSQCIVEEGGIVNKYIGDSILAVFGVPIGLDNNTAAAIGAAYKMRSAKAQLNAELAQAGLPPMHSGIGIHAGPVLAGNIGSSSRMEYTVIGDTVNVAARMEKLCKEFDTDIILSEAAVLELGPAFQAQDLGLVNIRGKEQPLRLFAPAH